MRSRELELEIRMKKKPNVSNKGRLYIHGGADAQVEQSAPEETANEPGGAGEGGKGGKDV